MPSKDLSDGLSYDHIGSGSSALIPGVEGFVAEMENFAEREEVPVVLFRKGERKDDIAGEHLKRVTKPEGVKLRTETTSNNTHDFGIGKPLKNLPALRQIGFKANRRVLDVETISHDCSIGEEAFEKVVRPIEVEGKASALRFRDGRVQALFSVLVLFSLQARGFYQF